MQTDKPTGPSNAAGGASKLTVGLGEWVLFDERLPCKYGEQVDILFCSPDWATAIVGMFSNFGDSDQELSWYDQTKDKYMCWDSEKPTHWTLKLLPPNI